MICSQPEFCPWCTCRAPHTHFCRSGLTQSVQHCDTAVRSQKIIYGQKTCAFLCSPCWIWKSRKPSRLERCRFPSWPGSLARAAACGTGSVLPAVRSCSGGTGRAPAAGVAKAGSCAASSYCATAGLSAHLERVAEASQV